MCLLAERMAMQGRHEFVEPEVVRARRVLAEPMVVRAQCEFVDFEVRARCVLAVCYGHTALDVCL